MSSSKRPLELLSDKLPGTRVIRKGSFACDSSIQKYSQDGVVDLEEEKIEPNVPE